MTLSAQSQPSVTLRTLNPDSREMVVFQGGLLLGQTEADNRVWLNRHKVRVAADGFFIIGFGRDAVQSELLIESASGEQYQQIINVKSRQYKIQRINGLPPSKVNPKGKAILQRIRKESLLVKTARNHVDSRQDFKAGFIWPAKGRISGVYGSQRILNGDAKRPHFGVDIAAPIGTKVIAPAAGRVTLAENDLYFSGGTLIVDHGFGLTSTFLHLSKITVKVGQYVEQGMTIAQIGATGRATGPHLDWRMNWFTVRLDPELLVNHLPIKQQ